MHSITVKLVLIFVAIIVLPMTITTFTGVQTMANRLEKELEQSSNESLNYVKNILVQQLKRAEGTANLIANAGDVKRNMGTSELQDTLNGMQELWFPAIVEIFDTEGVAAARGYSLLKDDRVYFCDGQDEIVQATLSLEVQADYYAAEGGLVVRASAPIVNLNTLEVMGAVVATYPLDLPYLQSLKEQVKSEVTLLPMPDELTMVSTLARADGRYLDEPWEGALTDPRAAEDANVMRSESILAGNHAITYSPLKDNDGEVLALLSTAIDHDRIDQSKSAAIRIMLVSAVIAFIVAVIVGMLTAYSFTKPIHYLSNAIHRMTHGHLNERVRVTQKDELGRLAFSLNQMADSLERNQKSLIEAREQQEKYAAKLADLNNNLETKVHERTRELEEANRKLQELDKMKTDFLSTVSHELRTPLTSVLGFAKIIKKRLEKAIFPKLQMPEDDKKTARAVKQVSENIDIIVEEGERLTDLINDVLDIAKMEAGKMIWKMERLAGNDLIERALAATTSLFHDTNLTLVKEVSSDLPAVKGDKDRLIQVLINLVSNAVKFTEEGSITCRAVVDDAFLVISVADNGIGISKADQEAIFDKFGQVGDTLTGKPKGTGLGLPICKQIVEHHGGKLWVESQVGIGSTFFFTIPLTEEDDDSISERHIPSRVVEPVEPEDRSPEEHAHKNILVVDDDAHIRRLLREELEADGYLVREAEDGVKALAIVKQEPPDLIVMDVMMPNMSGFDVAAVLKNDPALEGIPLVILSVIQDRERGQRLGVDGYFTKPINLKGLLQDIHRLVKQGDVHRDVVTINVFESTSQSLQKVLTAKGFSLADGPVQPKPAPPVNRHDERPAIILDKLTEGEKRVKTIHFKKGLDDIVCFFVNGSEPDE